MAKNRYVVTFFTQYGALHYAKLLKKESLPAETKPVPRVLSSSCGICVETEMDKDIMDFVTEDVDRIYAIAGKDTYRLEYKNKEQ